MLRRFESITGPRLDLHHKYLQVLVSYGKDLETARKLYQRQKHEPMIARNLPPISGKIAWARQLYRRIETPMKVFQTKPAIIKVCHNITWTISAAVSRFRALNYWDILYMCSRYYIIVSSNLQPKANFVMSQIVNNYLANTYL